MWFHRDGILLHPTAAKAVSAVTMWFSALPTSTRKVVGRRLSSSRSGAETGKVTLWASHPAQVFLSATSLISATSRTWPSSSSSIFRQAILGHRVQCRLSSRALQDAPMTAGRTIPTSIPLQREDSTFAVPYIPLGPRPVHSIPEVNG